MRGAGLVEEAQAVTVTELLTETPGSAELLTETPGSAKLLTSGQVVGTAACPNPATSDASSPLRRFRSATYSW